MVKEKYVFAGENTNGEGKEGKHHGERKIVADAQTVRRPQKVLVDLKRALNCVFYCNKNTGQKDLNGRRDPLLNGNCIDFFRFFGILPWRPTPNQIYRVGGVSDNCCFG